MWKITGTNGANENFQIIAKLEHSCVLLNAPHVIEFFGLKSARFASKKKKQKDCYACVRKPFRRTHFINAISNIHCTGLMYAVAFARAIYQCIHNCQKQPQS